MIVWIRGLVGLFITGAGVVHFVRPRWYGAILPAWVTIKPLLVYGSGVAEILVGLGLLYPPTARWAALALLGMMLAFLPLHLYHLYQPPGKIPAAYWVYVGRAILQLLIIWGCWRLYQATA